MTTIEIPSTPFTTLDGADFYGRQGGIGFVKSTYKETKRPVEGAVVFAPALWQWD